MFHAPTNVDITARDCHFEVTQAQIDRLRAGIGGHEGRLESYAFVSRAFQAVADDVLGAIGRPVLTVQNGWAVFSLLLERMEGNSEVVELVNNEVEQTKNTGRRVY